LLVPLSKHGQFPVLCFPCLTIVFKPKLYAYNSVAWHQWITKNIEFKLTSERKGAFESLPEVRPHPHTWMQLATTYPLSPSLFNALSPLK